MLASQCIWSNQILSIKSLIRFASYHSNKYWEGINIASPGWFTILHRLQTIYIASQMTLWKLLIIIIRNLENNFVIVFVRYIQGGSSISPLNIHKRYLTSDNSVKEQLTCSSWFNISGPINWEISLPIYMLLTKEKINQIWSFQVNSLTMHKYSHKYSNARVFIDFTLEVN